jgi:16S rRNA (uracil1498-N3)-methyltransferase
VPHEDSPVAARAAAAAQVFVDDPGAPVLSTEDRHHLSRVLRLAEGEEVVATDGRGAWCLCTYDGSALRPLGETEEEPAPLPAITIAFAPPKGERPEWAVQKLTELGVDRIVPLATERSVVRWEHGRAERALERLRRVARSAAAQCRRVWLPEILPVTTLAELSSVEEGGLALAQLDGGPPTLSRAVLAVGPEGGWGPAERALGLPEVSLGPNVLRAETAVVTAGALLSALRAGTVVTAGDGSDNDQGSR